MDCQQSVTEEAIASTSTDDQRTGGAMYLRMPKDNDPGVSGEQLIDLEALASTTTDDRWADVLMGLDMLKDNDPGVSGQQSVPEEAIASTSTDDQRAGAHSQTAKEQEEQQWKERNLNMPRRFPEWNNPHNIIWRYFTPGEYPSVICNICGSSIISRGKTFNLHSHLITTHIHIISEIREEIQRTFSQRFEFRKLHYRFVRCTVCGDNLSIFSGIEFLRWHMNLHNIRPRSTNSVRIPENNPGVSGLQSVDLEDLTSTFTDDQWADVVMHLDMLKDNDPGVSGQQSVPEEAIASTSTDDQRAGSQTAKEQEEQQQQ